MFAIKFYTYNY